MFKAEEGMLGGAVWRRTPAVALNSGITSINTVPETNPMHRTSAFFTLQHQDHTQVNLDSATSILLIKLHILSIGKETITLTSTTRKPGSNLHCKTMDVEEIKLYELYVTEFIKKYKHLLSIIIYLRIESAITCKQTE